MRRLSPTRANDAPKQARYDVFLALVNLCAFIDKPYVVVSQAKLLERLAGTTGHKMSRRTLNRHLLGLERAYVINRTKRHQRTRRGELLLRSTLYTFGRRGLMWIKRLRDMGRIPLGRLAVPKMAQSQYPLSMQKCPHCGQVTHSGAPRGKGKSRPPRKRGGAYGPPGRSSPGRARR